MEAFYTKDQVIKKLNIPNSTLYQMVKDGRLHPLLPRGKKRGMVFDVAEIDTLLWQIKVQVTNNPQILTVEILDEHDMAEVAALSAEWLGRDRMLLFSTLRTWWRKNPAMFMGIRNADGFLWGITAVIPLPQTLIERICDDEHLFFTLTEDDIQPYSPAYENACYIPFIRVDMNRHLFDRLEYLLAHDALEHYFMALGRMRIPIARVYFKDIAEKREVATEAGMMRTHKFHDVSPLDVQDSSGTMDGSQGMVVVFDQVDSALVGAYYAGKRESVEGTTGPSFVAQTPQMNLAFYYIPGEGIYSPVIDDHYFDRASGKLVMIPSLLIPGQKQRGRPPKQPE